MYRHLLNHCEDGDLDKIKKLVNLGVDFRAENDYPIRLASLCGNLNVVQYLVELGADFRADNNTAIVWASAAGHLHVVQYLVSLGANFRADNDCAIRFASCDGRLNVVQYLIGQGADLHANDNDAVHLACMYGHSNVAHYLISLGAYRPDIKVTFDVVNNLFSTGHFDAIHKLINNNNCIISGNKIEQFNAIKKSVIKIIEVRKWNLTLFCKLNYADLNIQFNLS